MRSSFMMRLLNMISILSPEEWVSGSMYSRVHFWQQHLEKLSRIVNCTYLTWMEYWVSSIGDSISIMPGSISTLFLENCSNCRWTRQTWIFYHKIILLLLLFIVLLAQVPLSYLSVKGIIMQKVRAVKLLAVSLIQCYHIFPSIEYLNLSTD